MKNYCLLVLVILICSSVVAQKANTGILVGTVKDKNNQEPLIGVSVQVEGQTLGVATDVEGKFRLVVPVGSINLKTSYIGYKSQVKFNVVVTSGNINTFNFELEEDKTNLNEVTVKANRATAAVATIESPNSIQRLSTEEIKSNPGGNFDISKVIQSLPGVGGGTSAGGPRNDIIIRGGAPNENVFYLDGFEIPVINHFATQGSAGGPQGILNVSFLEDVTLKSSAWEARYDNALSSVLQFKQKEGNSERLQGNIRLSGTELATTLEGPLSNKTTFLASARRSYLSLLFKALDLPIRPDYWDFQYKVTHKINAKTTLTAIGVGAIDDFSFAVPKKSTPENTYIIGSNPIIKQWSYTMGIGLKKLINDGYYNVTFSRNMFDNELTQYQDNTKTTSPKTLSVNSQEIENKLRLDVSKFKNGWKLAYGGVLQFVKYNSSYFNQLSQAVKSSTGQVIQPAVVIDFGSAIDFWRFGAYVQTSKTFGRLGLSAGLRTDGNSFTINGTNLLKTLSPRLAASYALNEKWNVNASVGRYYKLPIYTVLGYRDAGNNLVNKDNEYIGTTHLVSGIEYVPQASTRFTLEGFYKKYDNYPISARNGTSLANQGTEFTGVGNERTLSTGKGNAYGFEAFFQQKLTKNYFTVLSYTFVRSEFAGADGKMVASAWDSRNLFSGLLGVKFKKNVELGLKYRYLGGVPYTPFDLTASRSNYAVLGKGTLDFQRLNTERLPAFNQLDIRIDKKWNYKRATLDLYLDIQNVTSSATPQVQRYTFARSETDWLTTDSKPLALDGSNAQPTFLANSAGRLLPTIGFIVEL